MSIAPIFMAASGNINILSAFIPFIMVVAVATITFFVAKAIHKKKHPDEDTEKETNRKRREREKLEKQTMTKVTDSLSGKKTVSEEKKPDGLRSGKHNKKKKQS